MKAINKSLTLSSFPDWMISFLLPIYCTGLGFSPAQTTRMFAMHSLFLLLGKLVSGRLCDRVGRRVVFLAGLVLMSGAYLLLAFAQGAALLAGMRIAEYHPHSLAVGYVEPSFDAMVSGTACDLKFCNESGGAVYVLCRVNENALTVSLYGEQTGVTYLRESVVTATVPPPEPELREGEEEKELRAAKNGVRSEGWLVRREAGREDVRTLLRRDSYAPVRAIRQVPPSAAEPVPQQPPSAG